MPPAPHSFVQCHNTDLVRDGIPVRLKGLNLGNWMILEAYQMEMPGVEYDLRRRFRRVLGEDRFRAFFHTLEDVTFAEPDAALIASCGLNCVQVPVNYRHFTTDGTTSGFDGRGFELLDRAIAHCRRHGLMVIVSLHAVPGVLVRDWNAESIAGEAFFYEHESFQSATGDLIAAIAYRYRDEPTVVGNEPLNEPLCDDRMRFNAVYAALAGRIRAAAPRQIVFLNSNHWGQHPADFDPALFEDEQVVPVVHHYPQIKEPIQGARVWPGELAADVLERQVEAHRKADAFGRPVLVGETGVYGKPFAAEGMEPLLDDLLGLWNRLGYHWTGFCYKDNGTFGIAAPAAQSHWAGFVRSEPAARIRGAWARRNEEVRQTFATEAPEVGPEALSLFIYQCGHHWDVACMEAFLSLLKDRSPDDLREMAMSWRLDRCTVHPARQAAYSRAARA